MKIIETDDKKLIAKAEQVFNDPNYKKFNQLFITDDEQVFLSFKSAIYHANTHKLKIFKVLRPEKKTSPAKQKNNK